jgi:hypothetical protein
VDPAAGLRITPHENRDIARRLKQDRERFQTMRRLITGKMPEPSVDEVLASESARLGVNLSVSTRVDSGKEKNG